MIDASNAAGLPPLAASLVEPGGRVVYIGLSAEPSLLDTRELVLKDVTAAGERPRGWLFPLFRFVQKNQSPAAERPYL